MSDRPRGRIRLSGQLICGNDNELGLVKAWLPEHIRLTRAEPGCLVFSVRQSAADPYTWEVAEEFTDRPAFEAHQERTRASAWFLATGKIRRDYRLDED